MRVLGISGSLRRGSFNTALLRHAAALFETEGAQFQIYDGLRDVPAYDEDFDVRGAPEAVARIRATVHQADAVVFATPEYNSSIPGVLKNTVDWLSRPSPADCALRGKPVAVVGASIGVFGALWAQAELRKVLGATAARVIEGEVALGQALERLTLTAASTTRTSSVNYARSSVTYLQRLSSIVPESSPRPGVSTGGLTGANARGSGDSHQTRSPLHRRRGRDGYEAQDQRERLAARRACRPRHAAVVRLA